MVLLAAQGLLISLVLAVGVWLWSLRLRDASLADRFWSVFVAAPAVLYACAQPLDARRALMLALMLAWALRLALYIGVRNWGHGEDRRYRDMRERNQPDFGLKSLYLVFVLQAALAWVVALPMLAAVQLNTPLGPLEIFGAALAAAGIGMEALADTQLARFRKQPRTGDQVLDQGLWRYSRHPNYFGEACVWWGLALMVCPHAWALASPLLMTGLLLKVSGVTLLEQDIGERRPAYRDYVARTSAFIPWPPRRGPLP